MEPKEKQETQNEPSSKPKEQPNFVPTGKAQREHAVYRGIELKWDEPPDMHLPTSRWRAYVFRKDDPDNPLIYYLHRDPGYMFGRDRRIADIPLDHLSCSAQHAVLYFREISEPSSHGRVVKTVKPFLMDLGSTNGTFLQQQQMKPNTYYELHEGDVVTFGHSTREYVFMRENSRLGQEFSERDEQRATAAAAASSRAEPPVEVNPILLKGPSAAAAAPPPSPPPAAAAPDVPLSGSKHAREEANPGPAASGEPTEEAGEGQPQRVRREERKGGDE